MARKRIESQERNPGITLEPPRVEIVPVPDRPILTIEAEQEYEARMIDGSLVRYRPAPGERPEVASQVLGELKRLGAAAVKVSARPAPGTAQQREIEEDERPSLLGARAAVERAVENVRGVDVEAVRAEVESILGAVGL
jgi:hypothetical protein